MLALFARLSQIDDSLVLRDNDILTRFDVARYNLGNLALAMAEGLGSYEASPDAPSTYDQLVEEWDKGGTFRVFDGGCADTIYFEEAMNHAFRFWHDHTHLELEAQFTTKGEWYVACLQREEVERVFGVDSDEARIIWLDTFGQVEYFDQTGLFLTDQRAFVLREFIKGIV